MYTHVYIIVDTFNCVAYVYTFAEHATTCAMSHVLMHSAPCSSLRTVCVCVYLLIIATLNDVMMTSSYPIIVILVLAVFEALHTETTRRISLAIPVTPFNKIMLWLNTQNNSSLFLNNNIYNYFKILYAGYHTNNAWM